MEDEYNITPDLKNDKKKKIILVFAILFILLMIGFFGYFGYVNFLEEKNETTEELNTTTRRTYTTTESTTTSTTTTELITTTTEVTTESTTSTTNTTKKTTTSKNVVTEAPTEAPTEATTTKALAVGDSGFANSVYTMEFDVLNSINESRRNNGLSNLSMTQDYRAIAESAANMMNKTDYSSTNSYLNGWNRYVYSSNDGATSSSTLYQKTISKIPQVINGNYKYVGIGVLHKNDGYYYYVIIYS